MRFGGFQHLLTWGTQSAARDVENLCGLAVRSHVLGSTAPRAELFLSLKNVLVFTVNLLPFNFWCSECHDTSI